MPDVDARLRPTSTKGALFLHVHPPPIAHTHCVKGPSICANHTATAVKSAIIISLQVATGCTGVMSVCANQSSLPRHNFGGCLATIANKGGINNSCYTRFERTSPRWLPTSNARASLPIDSKVQDVAGPDSVSFWGAVGREGAPSGRTPSARPNTADVSTMNCVPSTATQTPAPTGSK